MFKITVRLSLGWNTLLWCWLFLSWRSVILHKVGPINLYYLLQVSLSIDFILYSVYDILFGLTIHAPVSITGICVSSVSACWPISPSCSIFICTGCWEWEQIMLFKELLFELKCRNPYSSRNSENDPCSCRKEMPLPRSASCLKQYATMLIFFIKLWWFLFLTAFIMHFLNSVCIKWGSVTPLVSDW